MKVIRVIRVISVSANDSIFLMKLLTSDLIYQENQLLRQGDV